ncbi:RagB/SusD family nutrient uptake outer membrane protein [Flavobacterium sp. 2]|uniref:RagB/SusD family nutrient uptake outer membrane protein n=1 Tax=Flavobacterium sp. 2 TaxID=308053 RepID=UPI003CE8B383
MKKNIFKQYGLYLVMGCMFFASCEDALDTKIYSDMTPENFFKTEGDIKSGVTGLYVPCTTNWGYSDGGTGSWYNALFNADANAYLAAGFYSTDEGLAYGEGNVYENFTVGPASGGALNNTYNVIRFVARCTDIINQIAKSPVSDAVKERYTAEVKTLRAYYMFALLDWFGPVNVKLDPSTLSDNTILPRPDLQTYVGYIESDLNDAVASSNLPDKYNGDNTNWGRMSKAIAYGIQMKLYLHQKNWSKVKTATEKLMTMGFGLLPNYEDVFNNARNNEQIWAIPSNTASDNYFVTEVLPADFKKGYNLDNKPYIRGDEKVFFSGWQVYCMRWDFYDTFQNTDKRKKTILESYSTQSGEQKTRTVMRGAIPLKFTNTQFALYGIQKEQPIIRYAEVLLSYAEAENQLNGPTINAVNAAGLVADRANASIPNAAKASKQAFDDYLLAERGRELYFEGQRRQDLIRHGKFVSGAVLRGKNAQDFNVLYPIPQYVIIESNKIVKQNEGYSN